MQVTLIPISRKAKSRIGKQPVVAEVEQITDNKMFVVISPQQCRWVWVEGDPDFLVEKVTEKISPILHSEDNQS